MKISELKALSIIEKLSHLLTLQRIAPEFGKDIIYRCGYWDGILSGYVRWNGAILCFDNIMDEFSFAMPVSSEISDVVDQYESTTNTTRRYYAIIVQSDAKIKQAIRHQISFRRHVNPRCDYRHSLRHVGSKRLDACRKPDWRSWYDRSWPQIPDEPYDGEVIAWFTI